VTTDGLQMTMDGLPAQIIAVVGPRGVLGLNHPILALRPRCTEQETVRRLFLNIQEFVMPMIVQATILKPRQNKEEFAVRGADGLKALVPLPVAWVIKQYNAPAIVKGASQAIAPEQASVQKFPAMKM